MSASAAIADPLLRRAFGRRARPSEPPRTARVRIGSSRLRAPVSRRGSARQRKGVGSLSRGSVHRYLPEWHTRSTAVPGAKNGYLLLFSTAG